VTAAGEPTLVIAAGASADRPSVLDLYRAVWTACSAVFGRPRVRLGIELGFIGAWLVLRMAGAGFGPMAAWTAVAAVLAILSPGSGLVVLAAIAPWDEPLFLNHALGLRNLLPLALAVSIGLRILLHPRSLPRSVPFFVALGLLLITLGLGVGSMYLHYGRITGWDTLHFWLAGFGGAMMIFLVAVWLGHGGDRRPVWAAVIAASAAGLLSLAEYLLHASLAGLPIQGLLADKEFGTRLAGAIASPNAMVSLLVTPTAVLAAALVLGRDRRLRVVAAVVLPPLLLAMWFTYSRAALLGVFAIAVIILWRWRRWVGAGLLVAGLVAGIALTPSYLQARGSVIGGSATVVPGKVLIASDEQRITAWIAAGRMFVDEPLQGHGFRSYKFLGPDYGDNTLGSPHNEWIRLFAEEGIVGGVLGLAFVLSVAVRLAKGPGWLAAGALGGFVAWALTATFNNPFLFLQVSAIALTVAGVMVGFGHRKLPEGVPTVGTGADVAPADVPAPAEAG
jgi:O-antigen ligase